MQPVNEVTLLAASATPVGKIQSRPGAAQQVLEHELLAQVVSQAIADANVDKMQVGAMIFAEPHIYTRQKYFATFMAGYLDMKCDGGVMEILGNGMTGGLVFDRAADEIRLGRTELALALGVNLETAVPATEHMNYTMRAVGDVDFQSAAGFTPISWYAMDAVRYMHETGATREQISSVALKNRKHAELNPLAQFRKPMTIDDVLAAKPIVHPLSLLDVPPRSDGAICLVLASRRVAEQSGRPFVVLRGRGAYHEGVHQIADAPADMIALNAAQRAGRAAYDDAGLTPDQIDLAELYAPCTIVEILVAEALGLLEKGKGAEQTEAGQTTLGGRIPINTSGGCQSRGHPARLTPLYNALELYQQLTSQAGHRQVDMARIGLMCCELGNYNAALIHILEAA
ncbi:thiolase family protein [Hoeflea sp.]|uniref:thiolase family protein n=1 Tax=Hoeflea sp. TaxID=1940281 RepID=UPI000C10D18F|nr:thiolase family protein [Hoeflea sp.]MBC7280579.1 thiolase family protein [Hoeflea sp.]PHR21025.1 MAG: acetyl-CoA acyltransferase [Hoeflea sp.]